MTNRTRRDVFRSVAIGGIGTNLVTGSSLASTNAARRAEASVDRAPMEQYDAANTGYAPDAQGPRNDPVVLWEYEADGPVSASPAVVDGTTYVADRGGTVSAVDAIDGGTLWTYGTNSDLETSPTVVDGLMYVTCEDGTLHALDADDGRTEWSATVGSDPSPPVVVDDLTYVSGDGTLRVLDETGDEIESVSLTGDIASTPAVDDGVYVGTDEGTFYAFDVTRSGGDVDLVERWSIDTVVDRIPTVSVADGTVWATGSSPGETDQGRVYALDAGTGTEQWTYSVTPWIRGSVAVTTDAAYVGTDDGDVVAIDADDGSERWRVDANSSWSVLFWGPGVSGSSVVADDTLYVGSEDDSLYAIDVTAGTVLWRFRTGDDVVSTPTVVDGITYVGSDDGNVYAVTSPDVSPVPLPEDARDATADDAESGRLLSAAWTVVTSPLVLAGGFGVLLLLLAIGSAGADADQASTEAPTTLAEEDVPDALGDRRSTLRDSIDEFADRNGLGERAMTAIEVPEPESFEDVDAATAAYDRLEDEIDDWKDEWREVKDRCSELEGRIDRLGSSVSSVDAPTLDRPDLEEFRSIDDADSELDRLETRVERWATTFEEYRTLEEAEPEYEYLSVPEEDAIGDPASYQRPERALSAYESVADRRAARERADDALARLDESTAPVDAALVARHVSTELADADASRIADRVETAVTLVDRTTTLAERPDLHGADEFLDDLSATVEEGGLPSPDDLGEHERVLDGAEIVVGFLDRVDHGHPSIDADEWLEAANLALEESYPNVLDPVTSRIGRMDGQLWTHDHLQTYSWEEFEKLVGSLYRTRGYETEVTRKTADLGIDVWAEGPEDRIAVQAKQYERGNSVGRETLQKLASTLAKGDADRIVVVTTSTFARTAEEYAVDFGPEITLIDGDDLLTLLNESDLPPPADR